MEDLRAEQIEAVEALDSYNNKMINTIPTIVDELRGNAKPDTKDFLMQILNGMNWEIQVINGCLTYFNEDEVLIDKEAINEKVIGFNKVVESKDDVALADALENVMLPILKQLKEVIAKKSNK